MREYVQPARQHYAAQIQQGMDPAQISAIFAKFIATLVDLFKKTSAGQSLHDAVLAEASDFYDQVIAQALASSLPPVLASMVNTEVKQLWLSIASGLITTLVSVFDNGLPPITPPGAGGTTHGWTPY